MIAIDTETTVIPERRLIRSRSKYEIAVSPFEVPDLVVGSWARGEGGRVGTAYGPALYQIVEDALRGDEVVFHNLSFDYQVLTKQWPGLIGLFRVAAVTGRLHDTMLLDFLIRLAQGKFDLPVYRTATKSWSPEVPKLRSLATLYWEHFGKSLSKDVGIRCGFGEYRDCPECLPASFLEYAENDARATLEVFHHQRARLAHLGAKHYLSEGLQIRAALATAALDSTGVAVDQRMAMQLWDAFDAQMRPLEHQLVAAGYGRWGPGATISKKNTTTGAGAGAEEWKYYDDGTVRRWRHFKRHSVETVATPSFHLNTAVIQRALAALEVSDPDEVPRRADGTVGLDADYWSAEVPAGAEALQAWLRHEKLKKVVSTYLSVYSQSPMVFPRWHILGARSGRMSASRPNLQNVPKRKAGIRALFVPHEGYLFVKGDYAAQEMFTLCEIMLTMGINGALRKILTSGVDIHRFGASLILNKDPDQVTTAERQGQKALHFGVPGGLGPRKLAAYAYNNYGVDWTVEEAREKRERFLSVFTDIKEYLARMKRGQDACLRAVTNRGRADWASQLRTSSWNVIREMTRHADPEIRALGIQAEHQCAVELPSGRRRYGCRFTEAANTHFQGLASDVTKEACWNAHLAGLRIIMIVHDEIVIESKPENLQKDSSTLENCMLKAFRSICPIVGPYAAVEIKSGLTRWGEATDISGKALTI